MTKFKLSIILLILSSTFSYGQNCTCKEKLEWVKSTFEQNDAGFQYAIDKKGQNEYNSHTALYFQKVESVEDISECNKLLYEWLTFFRKGHFTIDPIETDKTTNSKVSTLPTTKTNDKWETVAFDLQKFEQYLDNKKEIDFEGIWEMNGYKIGIKKEKNDYIGFIIETEVETWKKGEVKLRINKDEKSIFYLRNKSANEVKDVSLLGNNYLQIGSISLKRVSPKYPADKLIEDYFKSILAEKPFIEELNKTTLILRIPTFQGFAKKDIDSVITANKDKILKTENLIIDLRNNGGGDDGSYKEIIPFLYTNAIRVVGVEYYSTKLNNQRMLDFINNPEYGFDEEDKKWAKESYDKLQKQVGQFVNLENTIVDIDTLDKISLYPKNVGIIINEGNGSTTEQFLLAAKQSKKVKLFGTTTFGVLDISNMYYVKSPCNDFELGYSLTRSLRIPEMTIDSKGIQPDYYIDKSIPHYKWVEFVNEIMNKE